MSRASRLKGHCNRLCTISELPAHQAQTWWCFSWFLGKGVVPSECVVVFLRRYIRRPFLRADMPALPAHKLAMVLEALRTHRNTRRAAKLTGVCQATAWRIARMHGIELISLSEHLKARRLDPAFVAKQVPAAREAARRCLKAQQAKPAFRKKSIEAARRNMNRLNGDPAFREASRGRLKRLHGDPAYRAKLYAALSASHTRKRRKRRAEAIKAALQTLIRFDADTDFRLAASERLSRFIHTDFGQVKGAARP